MPNTYEQIYDALLCLLNGEAPESISLNHSVGLIEQSHVLVSELITRFEKGEIASTSTIADVHDRRGWTEWENCRIEDGDIQFITSRQIGYVFPAVRLVLVAIGERLGVVDPASRLLVERAAFDGLLGSHHFALDDHNSDPTSVRRALDDFIEFAEFHPLDERAWYWIGRLQAQQTELSAALNAYFHCLCLRWSGREVQASAAYNIACIYARNGDSRQARLWLEASDLIQVVDRVWLAKDPDFESKSNEEWFREFLGSNYVLAG